MQGNRVLDWMARDLITIRPHATLPEAHRMMKAAGTHHLLVIEFGQLEGIISWGDLGEARPPKTKSLSIYELSYQLSRLKVADVMTPHPLTIPPHVPLTQAARTMYIHGISALPVLEDGKLIGILTQSDVFRALAYGLSPESAATTQDILEAPRIRRMMNSPI